MSDFSTLSKLTAEYQRQVAALVARESARHMMDMHLPFDVLDTVEGELLPVLQQVMEAIEWEPGDAELLGEPAMTSSELHDAAWKQHVSAHN
jgi:hypothetical protein